MQYSLQLTGSSDSLASDNHIGSSVLSGHMRPHLDLRLTDRRTGAKAHWGSFFNLFNKISLYHTWIETLSFSITVCTICDWIGTLYGSLMLMGPIQISESFREGMIRPMNLTRIELMNFLMLLRPVGLIFVIIIICIANYLCFNLIYFISEPN